MQDETAAQRQERSPLPIDRTCRKMAARKHLHHPHPEVGNQTMGRSACRLRQEMTEQATAACGISQNDVRQRPDGYIVRIKDKSKIKKRLNIASFSLRYILKDLYL